MPTVHKILVDTPFVAFIKKRKKKMWEIFPTVFDGPSVIVVNRMKCE